MFPSLGKCYKKNADKKCCNLVHDEVIDERLKNIFHERCQDLFPEFDQLFCLVCDDREYDYVKQDEKKVYLCDRFARVLWDCKSNPSGGCLDKNTKYYDNCGMKKTDETKDITDDEVIVPSKVNII